MSDLLRFVPGLNFEHQSCSPRMSFQTPPPAGSVFQPSPLFSRPGAPPPLFLARVPAERFSYRRLFAVRVCIALHVGRELLGPRRRIGEAGGVAVRTGPCRSGVAARGIFGPRRGLAFVASRLRLLLRVRGAIGLGAVESDQGAVHFRDAILMRRSFCVENWHEDQHGNICICFNGMKTKLFCAYCPPLLQVFLDILHHFGLVWDRKTGHRRWEDKKQQMRDARPHETLVESKSGPT